uniref:Uncharacterized protein n=1 Tax=Cyclopterus lumpus TaxID=8103 RepID=A0A8C2ZVI8_CYCLU
MAEKDAEVGFKKVEECRRFAGPLFLYSSHLQETVSKLLSSFFKEDKTRLSGDATLLMTELLKIFVQGETVLSLFPPPKKINVLEEDKLILAVCTVYCIIFIYTWRFCTCSFLLI